MPMRLRRSSLLARIAQHPGPVAIVAPRGYGKTTLVSTLRECAGFSPVCVPEWIPAGWEILVESTHPTPISIEDALADGVSMVMASRTDSGLPDRVHELLQHPDVLRLDHDDLAFTVEEIEELATTIFGPKLGFRLSQILARGTGGWPQLVSAHLEGLARGNLLEAEVLQCAVERVDKSETLGAVLRPILRELSRDEVVQLATLAFAKTIPEEAAIAASGIEFLDRCRTLGLPLINTPDGRVMFTPPVASFLRTRHEPDSTTIKRMVPALLATDASMQAIHLLIGIGELDEAALILKELRRRDLETLNPTDFMGAISLLESVAHEWPELHLQRARMLRRTGNLDEAKGVLIAVLRERLPQKLEWEVEAEYCFQSAADGDSPNLLERIENLLKVIPTTETATRATLHTARGVFLASSDDLEQICDSEASLLLAARQWESLGDNHFAARTLRILASTTLSELGRFVDVRRVLERSMQLVEGQATNRLIVMNLLSRTAALSGDLDAFARYDAEVEGLVNGATLEWTKGYTQWSRMHAAAWRLEQNAVIAHQRKAAQYLVSFKSQRTGAVFLAESAEAYARAGLLERARQLLDEVRAHPMSNKRMITMASIAISAASGEIDATREQVDTAITTEGIPQSLRWRMLFHIASAAYNQCGIVEPELLHLIELEADVVGEAAWPRRLSPQFWALPDAKGAASRAADELSLGDAVIEPLAIQILGGFAIRNGSQTVPVTSGHGSTLVKLIAVRGGCVPIEVAIDLLWPEVDVETGRRRLKNVVSRLRKELGERAVVRSDQTIAFGIDVRLDLNEFDQRARNAMVLSAARSPEAVAAAVDALDVYRGALLPLDLYDDWIEEARTFSQARAASILDLVRVHAPRSLEPWLAATELRINNREI